MARVKRTNPSRRKSPSRRKRRRSGGIKVLMFLLLLVTSSYAAYQLDVGGYFTIKQVETSETVYVEAAELDSLCEALFVGRSIFSDLGPSKDALTSGPLIRKVRCLRRFPDRLRVQVVERRPVALANVGEILPVDDEGYVLPLDINRHRLELPVITPSSAGAVSIEENTGRMKLDKQGRRLVQAVLCFKDMAPELLPRISEFAIGEQGKITLITMEEGLRVVMGKWVEPKNIEYLRWMFDELDGRDDVPSLVDLSFKGQIIVKNN
ncbi:MAG: FtsQ-type POTRA domain-containing protein [Candidatus Glassbacteria bacterium]|nr:FtsQ-type POTRA domain-containing protein [Candidatus Glassbacteria bacterium]